MADIEPITVKAAAARLDVSEGAVRRMIAKRQLTGNGIVGSRYVRLDAGEVDAKIRLKNRVAHVTCTRV